MKPLNKITLLMFVLGFVYAAQAQDDFYPSSTNKSNTAVNENFEEEVLPEDNYSTATDYYYEQREHQQEQAYNDRMGITDSTTYYEDENGNVRITNNYYNGDNYDFDNEYYDYEYAARIRRFRRNSGTYGYYDDYYTNYYWYGYDPYFYGTSIYTSYNWWYPRTRWNVGWSYWGGWNVGWSWGWGWTGSYGYCGVGYYGWNRYYGPNYWNGYNYGYHNSYYAGNNNYYNSYDRNSYYYGKRGSRSGYSGYGTRGRRSSSVSGGYAVSGSGTTSPTINRTRTFGEKYEAAVRNEMRNSKGVIQSRSTTGSTISGNRPKVNGYNNSTAKTGRYNVSGGTITKPNRDYSKSKTNTARVLPNGSTYNKSNTNTKNTRVTPNKNTYTRSKTTHVKPRTSTTYTKPRSTYNKPKTNTYIKPKTTYVKPKTSYNKPKSTTRSSYNKSSIPTRSKPSYSRPSGSYNRSGSRPNSRSRSGGRR